MSNVYIQEPPALGKVLLKTSVGDIDVELWTKEAPKACRNFIQLCMEGYYNDTIFHRVVLDFIVQGGDPNGDGTGGDSIYGAPFKDEVHSRLRFNRRGLLAMANAGKDDNGSQFFFTLGPTPELQNKHTIFGKVSGETIFNMLKLCDGEIGPEDRPVYPHKITGAEVLINPFDDIVPRVKLKSTEDDGSKKKKKDRTAVKNFGLLSFGMEAEEDEGEAVEFRGKAKSTHDLLDDPKLGKKTAAELDLEESAPDIMESAETSQVVTNIREKLKSKKKEDGESKSQELKKRKERDGKSGEKINKSGAKKDNSGGEKGSSESEGEYYLGKDKVIERRKERDRVRGEISQLKKDMKRPKADPASMETGVEDGTASTLEKENELKRQYDEEQEKYRKLKENIPKKGPARQDYTLALLEKFKSKLSAMRQKSSEEQENEGSSETKADEVDDDVSGDSWLTHKLQFEQKGAVLAKDASTKGDDWFDIYDPRNPLNKRKREESERKQRAKAQKK